jgi:hypothetical protein
MFYWGTVTVHYFICVVYLDLPITLELPNCHVRCGVVRYLASNYRHL